MKAKTNYIPTSYRTATPYLIVDGGARAIEFYQQAFGAAEVMRLTTPGGQVMHAESTVTGRSALESDAEER